jgi:hypothetical protein
MFRSRAMVNTWEEQYEKRIDATVEDIIQYIGPVSVYSRLTKTEFRELTRRIVDMQNLGDSEESIITMMRTYSLDIENRRKRDVS